MITEKDYFSHENENWNTYQGNLEKDPDTRWYNQMFGKIYQTIDKIKRFLAPKKNLEKLVKGGSSLN